MSLVAGSSVEPKINDDLIAGNKPEIATNAGVLITGQNIVRGTVVGRITATGLLTECDSAATDGSQLPLGILAHDVDATASDKQCQFYVAGVFRKSVIVWHASFATDIARDAAFDRTAIVVR